MLEFIKLWMLVQQTKIFEELGDAKIDLVVNTLKNMNNKNAAQILEEMDENYAAKVTQKLSEEYGVVLE